MLPALRPGDWLVARRTRRIRPGQVVLAFHPGRPGFLLVKRATRRVDGGWWLESDNPVPGAVDSNRLGPVQDEWIVGPVLARYGRKSRSLSFRRNDSGAPRSLPATTPRGIGRGAIAMSNAERPRTSQEAGAVPDR